MLKHDWNAVAFPKLDEGQLASLGSCPLTAIKRYRKGEKLFEAGVRNFTFCVIKSGAVEILDESGDQPKAVTVLGRGEFTGDAGQLTGGPVIVTGIARDECEVFEVTPESLRQILNNHPDLGDVILQAFIARWQLLASRGPSRAFASSARATRVTLSGFENSWPRTTCRSPGWTWMTTLR